jgi:thymidylate kinase
MIILEGADCVGKTTLQSRILDFIRARTDYPVVPAHFGRLPSKWDYYWDYLPHINRFTVMDRFVLSEMAYGSVLRGGHRLSEPRLLQAELSRVGSVTAVLYASDPSVIKDRYSKEREAFPLEGVLRVNEWYRAYLRQTQPITVDFSINVTGLKVDDAVYLDFIRQVCDTWQGRQQTISAVMQRLKARSHA